MMRTLDLRGGTRKVSQLRDVVPRASIDVESAVETVRPIVDDIRKRGAAAAIEWSAKFDGVAPDSIRVPADVISAALKNLDPVIRASLEEAIKRVRIVHEHQRRS